MSLQKFWAGRPVCSAVPAWKCNDAVLTAKSKFDFKYNSDCRGQSIFYPVVDGQTLSQPQIPVTLPTYDEAVGKNGISDSNYNDYMLSLLNPSKLNVLTIHAEVEGIAKFDLFRDFLKKAKAKGVSFVPLGELLADSSPPRPCRRRRKRNSRPRRLACVSGDKINLSSASDPMLLYLL